MSRRVANHGLGQLLKTKQTIFSDWQVADIQCTCGVSRQQILNYTTSRKSLPRVEEKMAACFGLTIPALRRKLFGTTASFEKRQGQYIASQPRKGRKS